MDTQQAITLAVVILAAGYLVRRTWLRLSGRRTGGCGACVDCPAAAGGGQRRAPPLVPLDTLIASAQRQAKSADVREQERPPDGQSN